MHKSGRATATGGMNCMGASVFQPPLMIFEVLKLSIEGIKTVNKENKKCLGTFTV